jgi:long-chain acyl-CoA synthetase
MPNIPQSLDCFYALNRIGAVANMIHPQSALEEVIYYLNFSKSKAIVVPDMFYEKIIEALKALTTRSR